MSDETFAKRALDAAKAVCDGLLFAPLSYAELRRLARVVHELQPAARQEIETATAIDQVATVAAESAAARKRRTPADLVWPSLDPAPHVGTVLCAQRATPGAPAVWTVADVPRLVRALRQALPMLQGAFDDSREPGGHGDPHLARIFEDAREALVPWPPGSEDHVGTLSPGSTSMPATDEVQGLRDDSIVLSFLAARHYGNPLKSSLEIHLPVEPCGEPVQVWNGVWPAKLNALGRAAIMQALSRHVTGKEIIR